MFWRREKKQDRLRRLVEEMSPEDYREALAVTVFHQALRGRVHLMTGRIRNDLRYYDLMRTIGERQGVKVALCPVPEKVLETIVSLAPRRFGDLARRANYDENARIVIGNWSYFRILHDEHVYALKGMSITDPGPTSATGATAMVEDDTGLFVRTAPEMVVSHEMLSLYDDVIRLPKGPFPWPMEE